MWNKKIDVNLKKKVNINEIIELCMRKCFSDKKKQLNGTQKKSNFKNNQKIYTVHFFLR